MKKLFVFAILIILVSCKDDDVNLFDKTAEQRATEAINGLKEKLVDSEDGWLVRYSPAEDDAGSYYVILKFNEDNTVNIKSDLAANDGAYLDQTITYRIDNSLGLELILESYSFFAYLYELDQATFPAEYEFIYESETDEGNLIFHSKTDLTEPKTVLEFIEAKPANLELLATDLATALESMSSEFEKFTSSLALAYDNKDIVLYIAMDEARRVLTITSATKKNLTSYVDIDHTTTYYLSGDSIKFDTPLVRNILGNSLSISSIRFTSSYPTSLNICDGPINLIGLQGSTSQNDNVKFQTTLFDAAGATFTQSPFYFAPNIYIFNNGESAGEQIEEEITGALEMHLYYNYDLGSESLYGIGFVLQNADESITFALREFTPVLTNNNLVFQFADDITLFGNPNPDADISRINYYLEQLTAGDETYVFKITDGVYEFYNPCTKWTFVFIDAS